MTLDILLTTGRALEKSELEVDVGDAGRAETVNAVTSPDATRGPYLGPASHQLWHILQSANIQVFHSAPN